MKDTIKVIIKKPNEPIGYMKEISNDLKTLQDIVGGLIETVWINENTVLICNDEGKMKHLRPNIWVGSDIVCGTVIVCGVDGEDFTDSPIRLGEWVELIETWGNRNR